MQVALEIQFAFIAWRSPNRCLVIRDHVPLSCLHSSDEGVAATVADKVLGCERGEAARRWLCKWQCLLVGVPAVVVVMNLFVDWFLPRNKAAQVTCCFAHAAISLWLSNV